MTELTSTTHCKECGGKCCTHYPHILEKEMHRIKSIVGDNIEMAFEPVKGLKGWYKFTTPCPLFNPEEGCCLEPADRPLVCQIYPFSPISCSNGWILLLDVAQCPAWRYFGERYDDAEKIFVKTITG